MIYYAVILIIILSKFGINQKRNRDENDEPFKMSLIFEGIIVKHIDMIHLKK